MVGEMAEWFKAHAWKACVGNTTVSSNLTLSATFKRKNELLTKNYPQSIMRIDESRHRRANQTDSTERCHRPHPPHGKKRFRAFRGGLSRFRAAQAGLALLIGRRPRR